MVEWMGLVRDTARRDDQDLGVIGREPTSLPLRKSRLKVDH